MLQEVQLQRMRQLAVVPPMLLDKEERRVVFINNNGFIMDPFADFKVSLHLLFSYCRHCSEVRNLLEYCKTRTVTCLRF